MAYPTIFRERAIEALRGNRTKTEVTEIFNLGIHTLKNWEKLEEETGNLQKRELNRNPRKIDREELKKYVEENPFATHIEAAAHFECSESGIRHAKKALGITRKKRQLLT